MNTITLIQKTYSNAKGEYIAYCELWVELYHEPSNTTYEQRIEVPKSFKRKLNDYARSLGFTIGKVDKPLAERKIYFN